MRLRGKIDRVDICEDEDNVYVKVIDYKTGAKAFDLGELSVSYTHLCLLTVVFLEADHSVRRINSLRRMEWNRSTGRLMNCREKRCNIE